MSLYAFIAVVTLTTLLVFFIGAQPQSKADIYGENFCKELGGTFEWQKKAGWGSDQIPTCYLEQNGEIKKYRVIKIKNNWELTTE